MEKIVKSLEEKGRLWVKIVLAGAGGATKASYSIGL